MKVHILKRDGRIEEFKKEKIVRTCRRAGASERIAQKIAKEVENKIYDGITTDEILSLVLDLLTKYEYPKGIKYDLKKSLLRLGPSGFGFEKFVARLLEEYGYSTRTNIYVEGKCVRHEIDVIAEKDEIYMIECKFHNLPIYTGLKEVMYTYARFQDIDENIDNAGKKDSVKFDGVWIFTNTKFSEDAKRYAKCRGIKLTGWNYPEKEGIEIMLERKNLYPLSILKVDRPLIDRLVNAGYVFCRDVAEVELEKIKEKTDLKLNEIKRIRKEVELILGLIE
jgi:hypothetical protein